MKRKERKNTAKGYGKPNEVIWADHLFTEIDVKHLNPSVSLTARATYHRSCPLPGPALFTEDTEAGRYDAKMTMGRDRGLFGNGPETLTAAYDRLLEGGRYKLETALAIEKSINAVLDTGALKGTIKGAATDKPEYVLFREIQKRLRPTLGEPQARFQNNSLKADRGKLRQLDDLYLNDSGAGKPHYLTRWDFYTGQSALLRRSATRTRLIS